MNTAQPAFLPPGVWGSGGISRSASDSTAAPSSGVKYNHAPGPTGVGGAPAFGAQGKLSFTISARAEAVEKNSATAVVASSSRRLKPEADDRSLEAPNQSSSVGRFCCRPVRYWKSLSVAAMVASLGTRAFYFLLTLTP